MAARAGRVGSGWVAFAGTYLGIAGVLNLIWGITALSKKEYFAEGGLVWSNLDLWGWLLLIVGITQVLTGLLLFARKLAGILIALVVSMSGIVVNFLAIGAYPIWSIVAMTCNALVLWAITVHSDEFT